MVELLQMVDAEAVQGYETEGQSLGIDYRLRVGVDRGPDLTIGLVELEPTVVVDILYVLQDVELEAPGMNTDLLV
jgi:hypothetical protein